MSMWVYNKVICKSDVKDKIINNDYFESFGMQMYCYGLNQRQIENDVYELRFETHGSEYYDEEIRHIIENYHDVKWYCTQEEIYQQGFYYWDEKVQLEIKDVCFGGPIKYDAMYMNYDFGLYIWWPRYTIAFYNSFAEYNLVIDDFDNFKTYKYILDEKDLEELASIFNNRDYVSEDGFVYVPRDNDCDWNDLRIDSRFGSFCVESIDLETVEENKYGELKYLKGYDLACEVVDRINAVVKKYNSDFMLKIPTSKK